MEQYYYVKDALPHIIRNINARLSEQLRILLETKHIYQKVTIDVAAELAAFEQNIYGDDRELFADTRATILEDARLDVADRELLVEDKHGPHSPVLMLHLKSVKLFCQTCDGKEAFRPVWWSDATAELKKPAVRERMVSQAPSAFQLFTVVYQCQRCAGAPHAFLVRRDGWQLFLDGRSPFEEVEVPAFLPKPERWLYRDSVIAAHGGKILAALYYLRTFIEQFARRQTKLPGRVTGDELMTAYGESLPPQQRDHMPSLRE